MAEANSTQSVPQLDDATRAGVEALLDLYYTALHDAFSALAIVLDPRTVARLDVDPGYLREMLARQALSSVREMMERFGEIEKLLALLSSRRDTAARPRRANLPTALASA